MATLCQSTPVHQLAAPLAIALKTGVGQLKVGSCMWRESPCTHKYSLYVFTYNRICERPGCPVTGDRDPDGLS